MGFQFEQPKTVEVCGKDYPCDPGNPDILLGAAKDFQEIVILANKLKALALPETTSDAEAMAATEEAMQTNLALIAACRRMIEGCLGEAEYAEIFSQRRPNSAEHLKLCTYLFEYLTAERDKVVQKYLDLPEVNEDAADNAAARDTRAPD